jgi:hypothetical protein
VNAAAAARRSVLAVLGLGWALIAVLLLASFIPSATLASRLLGVVGEARAGAYAQELTTSLDVRLRVAAGLLVLLLATLSLLRVCFEELVAASLARVARPRVERIAWLQVGVVTLAAVAVRIPFASQPMRYDEALTFNEFASRPLYYGLSFYPEPNNQLLNTLLMHLAYVVFGNQPWVLRLPALLGGVLLVPATYWLASELFSSRPAPFAAVLVGVSSYLVEYSTNGRGYTLQALCFVVMLGLIVRRRLVLAAGVAALGAYAVPTMLYGVIIAGVWLLVCRARWREVLTFGLLTGLLVTLLYLPVILISGPDTLVANRFVLPLELSVLPSELARSLAQTWAFWNRDIPLPLAALLPIGFALATFKQARNREIPVGVLAPLACLLMVLVQRVAPFERVWLFLLPLYFSYAAAGLARFVDGRLLGVVFGGVMGYVTLTSGSILSSTETGVFPDAEAVTQTLAPRLAPDDAVRTQLPASLPELQYYFPRYGLPIDVLVRSQQEAQNLWLIVAPGSAPSIDGRPNSSEVARFTGADLYELRR